MPRLHHFQALILGQRWGGIRGSGRNGNSYDDLLYIDGCYLVHICVRDTDRARELGARKETECRMKERMRTVPLSEFSRHRALESDKDRGGRGGS